MDTLCLSKLERSTGRRPSKSEMDDCEEDEHTGTWFPQPCENILSFSTEQRFEEVPPGEESETDVWRIAVFMSYGCPCQSVPVAGKIIRMEHRTGKGKRRGPFYQHSEKKASITKESGRYSSELMN